MESVTMEQCRNIALQAAYLTIGYQHEAAKHGADEMPKYQQDNGHLATVDRMAELAVIVDEYQNLPYMQKLLKEDGWPGVHEYEVTEAMGVWFHSHSTCTPEQFRAELDRQTREWLASYSITVEG